MVGEEFGHLSDKLIQELISLLVGRIHRGVEHTPLALNLVGPGSARKLRVADKPGRAVAGHVELRHNANSAVVRVCYQATNFVLRVVQPV